ncbi:MAG: CHAT domain-containing protein, partial [Gemmatimonadetes bacterium]|nr:CHAT domain-containing protein [Gemmatimonadota bacterium]
TTRAVRVLADPVLGPTSPLVPLPGARDEADAIARTGSEVEVWLGADATEARVRDRPPPAILHLAAHTDPRSPAVLLAPAEGSDGRLEPAEIRRIDIPGRIVVLSGCETGLSDVAGRTSVGVLSSAFLDAGAGSVIGALWKVEDRAIGKLMAALHERLAAGDRPSEALRRARGAMILSGRPDLNDPFLWGAFVVRGRDEALPPVAAHPGASATDFADAMLGAAAAAGMLLVLVGTLRGRRRRNATPPPAGTSV